MKTKIIIFGAALAAFLMLITPCISAVTVQAVDETIKEKISSLPIDWGWFLNWLEDTLTTFFIVIGIALMIYSELNYRWPNLFPL